VGGRDVDFGQYGVGGSKTVLTQVMSFCYTQDMPSLGTATVRKGKAKAEFWGLAQFFLFSVNGELCYLATVNKSPPLWTGYSQKRITSL
jgi:hypothetical protein